MRALRFVFGSGIIGGDYFSFTFFLRKVEIRQELERFSIEVTKAKKFFIPFFQKKNFLGFNGRGGGGINCWLFSVASPWHWLGRKKSSKKERPELEREEKNVIAVRSTFGEFIISPTPGSKQTCSRCQTRLNF